MHILLHHLNLPTLDWELLTIILGQKQEILESIILFLFSYFPTILRLTGYFLDTDVEDASNQISVFFTSMIPFY